MTHAISCTQALSVAQIWQLSALAGELMMSVSEIKESVSLKRALTSRSLPVLVVSMTFFALACSGGKDGFQPPAGPPSSPSTILNGGGGDRTAAPQADTTTPRTQTERTPERRQQPGGGATAELGGADPSGGEGTKSDSPELKKAVEFAFDEIEALFHRVWYFSADTYTERRSPQFPFKDDCYENLEGTCDRTIAESIAIIKERFSYDTDVVDGECPSSEDHKSADMSITKDLDLCISTNLLRYPEGELKKQVISLLAHEVLHGVGYGEDVATEVQQAILDYDALAVMKGSDVGKLRYEGNIFLSTMAVLVNDITYNDDMSRFCLMSEVGYDRYSTYMLHFSAPRRLIHTPHLFSGDDLKTIDYKYWSYTGICSQNREELVKEETRQRIGSELIHEFGNIMNFMNAVDEFLDGSTVVEGRSRNTEVQLVFEMAKDVLKNGLSEAPESLTCSLSGKDGNIVSESVVTSEFNGGMHDPLMSSNSHAREYRSTSFQLPIDPEWILERVAGKPVFKPVRLIAFTRPEFRGYGLAMTVDDRSKSYREFESARITGIEGMDFVRKVRSHLETSSGKYIGLIFPGQPMKAQLEILVKGESTPRMFELTCEMN